MAAGRGQSSKARKPERAGAGLTIPTHPPPLPHSPSTPTTVRPFFLGSLDLFFRYQRMEEGAIAATQPGGSLGPSTQQQQPARQLRQAGAVR